MSWLSTIKEGETTREAYSNLVLGTVGAKRGNG